MTEIVGVVTKNTNIKKLLYSSQAGRGWRINAKEPSITLVRFTNRNYDVE